MSEVEQCLWRVFAGIEGDVWVLQPREMLRSFHVDPSQLGGYVV